MQTFLVKDIVRHEVVRVLSEKLRVNDSLALGMSMSGLLVAVIAVSWYKC